MSEDARTLWVGNLHEDVTDELVYELFLQTGPIEKLIFPTEGEGDDKKNKGIAYILFKHLDSVKFSIQVMEGTKLFGNVLDMKARSMPITYRSTPPQQSNNRSRFHDNSSLRGSFNRTNTWHGRDEFQPRGRGNFRQKGNNFNQNTGGNFNQNQSSYSNFNNQGNSGYWSGSQQQNSQQQSSGGDGVEAKRQRMLQQQNMMIQGANYNQQTSQDQQQQQGMMGLYGMQQSQGQQAWSGGSWNNANVYAQYGNQYGNWYQQQQQ